MYMLYGSSQSNTICMICLHIVKLFFRGCACACGCRYEVLHLNSAACCMCIFLYMCTCVRVVCVHEYACTFFRISYLHVYIHTNAYMQIHTRADEEKIGTQGGLDLTVSTYIYMCMLYTSLKRHMICIYIYIYICIYIYI